MRCRRKFSVEVDNPAVHLGCDCRLGKPLANAERDVSRPSPLGDFFCGTIGELQGQHATELAMGAERLTERVRGLFGPSSFANVGQQAHEPRPLDGVLHGPLKGSAIAAALPAENLPLAGAQFLKPWHVLVIHVGRPRAAFFGAEPAAVFSPPPKFLSDH